jgi:hypothetical protein
MLIIAIKAMCIYTSWYGKTVHMCLNGKLAALLIQLEAEIYRKQPKEKGKDELYMKIQMLTTELHKMNFTIYPNHWSITMKISDGSQITITCHIDDLKNCTYM